MNASQASVAHSLYFLTFHQDIHSVPEYPQCGAQDEDWEDKCAYGVNDIPLRLKKNYILASPNSWLFFEALFHLEIDDEGGYEHSEALQEVSNDVDEGRLHIDVFLFGGVTMPPSAAVRVAVAAENSSHARRN